MVQHAADAAAEPAPVKALTAQREPPAWLIPAGLLFWGLHTGLWWLAAPLALLAALPAWRGRRFELATTERRRVADLCSLLIMLAGAWLLLNQARLGVALILLIQWLPGLLFPLLAVQLFSRRPGVELSVLFLSLRAGRNGHRPGGELLADLRWPYLLLCVLSASMIQPQTPWFLPTLVPLAAGALWPWLPALPRRTPLATGLLVLTLALAMPLAAGIRWGHAEAERAVLAWMEHWLGAGLDPYRATTAIGEVGRLKGSTRILLRVYPDLPQAGPLLLRTAGYDRYVNGTWFTTGSLFQPVPDQRGRRPLLPDTAQAAANDNGMRVVMLLRRAEGLLPVPQGTTSVSGLEGLELHRNGYGTLRYRSGGGRPLLNYHAYVAPRPARAGFETAPGDADLRVIGPDAPAIKALADNLGLARLPPAEAIKTLQHYFTRNFRYTLDLPPTPPDTGPLTGFLTVSRSGHCEYFATAGALVLRAAGIPARYVRGWSVQEFSPLEHAWIGRDSDAHAWLEAFVDGRWQTFDPTPPEWSVLEADQRPWTQQIGDFLAWLRLSFSGAAEEDRHDRQWLLLPLVALVLLLAWRIARRIRRGGGEGVTPPAQRQARAPTVFAELERAAARLGHGRRDGETLLEWARRLHGEGVGAAPALTDAVTLHYRRRFDPAGIEPAAERRLHWLLDDCQRRWR
ncbi:MAG: transglutaminase domain-containing protein [Thiohalocapsa sp.]|uniref:transglutaminase domain-containing protein n=1 Tax=Thiohalocapsa sp. TaxID=2497641 RepID=UPI0025FED592|nr:transglutaminase domain-containing protein [Thiohalocapsa sp.]MCG6941548.1 transglutaminase domain-containing protein [Thiohalocapsa sp.]